MLMPTGWLGQALLCGLCGALCCCFDPKQGVYRTALFSSVSIVNNTILQADLMRTSFDERTSVWVHASGHRVM